ncbi:sulfurtransferase TusA family protein [Bacillus sp. FJAT-49732]|uniref:Sulfurtransferase TusA family protein n=1 Tax=Lederbergia citrisecunda TaxID=2833583 RepID=A0A942TMA2_9BACI|nr:sulfurtransferase TusA family protein [Lederbergia citrisecunda]MBS4200891.1 sulfurtransferase TusA family protein [Lederbergia citrisecunda]
MNITLTLDAKGLACPMPIVRTKKAIGELESGQILEVLTTDKGSKADMTAWAGSQGHELISITEENGVFIFNIKKK